MYVEVHVFQQTSLQSCRERIAESMGVTRAPLGLSNRSPETWHIFEYFHTWAVLPIPANLK